MNGAASPPPLRCLCDVHGDKSAFTFIFLWKLLNGRHYIIFKNNNLVATDTLNCCVDGSAQSNVAQGINYPD